MKIGEWVSLISGIVVTVFGSGGIIAYLNFLSERRKWQAEMALKWAEFNSGKPETEARALEGAANAVKISAETLEKRFKELEDRANAQQNKIDEQEKHLEFADKTIAELKSKLQEMETEQKRYRAFVKSLATELLAELSRNGKVDLEILKHIVGKLLDGKDNDNDTQ